MRNIKSYFLLLAPYFLSLPILVAAADPPIVGVPLQDPVAGSQLKLDVIIGRFAAWATGLLILLAVVFIVYAAYLFLTSGGNEDDIKKAKNYIIYAAIAIAVALLANGVAAVVKGLVLGT